MFAEPGARFGLDQNLLVVMHQSGESRPRAKFIKPVLLFCGRDLERKIDTIFT
jgi:hypothetical protein